MFNEAAKYTVDPRQETAAIFTIVSRNFQPKNWSELLPEAQTQILDEAERLLSSPLLPLYKKQQLRDLLKGHHLAMARLETEASMENSISAA